MRSQRHVSDLAELLRFPFDRPRRLCVTKNRVFTCTSWPTSPSKRSEASSIRRCSQKRPSTSAVPKSRSGPPTKKEKEKRRKTRELLFPHRNSSCERVAWKTEKKKKFPSRSVFSTPSSSNLSERLRGIKKKKKRKGTRETLHAI